MSFECRLSFPRKRMRSSRRLSSSRRSLRWARSWCRVSFPRKKKGTEPPPGVEPKEPPLGPIVVPPEKETARRYYFVVAVSPRGREGPSSDVVSVRFADGSSAPGKPEIDYTATQITLKWEPPPNAKSWT